MPDQSLCLPALSLRVIEANGQPAWRSLAEEQPLIGRTVMVVEDDFLIAEDFAAILREAGAEVVGPAESLPQAVRLLQHSATLDCALLDVDLGGVPSFPVARELRSAGVPILFLTGTDCEGIPDEFADVICIGKPIAAARVVEEVAALLGRMPNAA